MQEFGLVGFLAHNLQAQYAKSRLTLGVRAQKTWGQLWAFLACCLAPSY